MTQSTLAFPSKRAPQAGSPLRLALELNPDGALVCTGDTLKDYLLKVKPHGFGWDAASGRWRRPGPGGRDAAHRLAAQLEHFWYLECTRRLGSRGRWPLFLHRAPRAGEL